MQDAELKRWLKFEGDWCYMPTAALTPSLPLAPIPTSTLSLTFFGALNLALP